MAARQARGELRRHALRIGGRDVTLLEGPAGWGECSPLPGYACDPAAARRAAEEAASEGFPVAHRTSVQVNALVTDDSFTVDSLHGFPAVKVKVRVPGDVDRVARVRDVVGPGVEVRVDANGAWDVETAVDVIERLEAYDVALVEQPVATLAELAEVRRRVRVAIAADEGVRGVPDARELRRLDAADVVVLKVQPLGGVCAALDVADEAGVPALPTSMMETSIGLAAGLALACALPELTLACGLGTAGALGADVTSAPLVAVDGVLTARTVVPDAALLERYALAPSSQAVSS
jgi:O-succinylbenzoate synthase